MHFPIYSLLFSTLVANSVVAAHSSTTNSHARRSLMKNNGLLKRKPDLGGLSGILGDKLSDIVGGITGNKEDDDSPPDNNPEGNNPSTITSDSTTSTSTSESTTASSTESTSTESTSTESTSTQPTPTTTSKNGGILDPVTSLVGGGFSDITSILGATSYTPSSASESATETSATASSDSSSASDSSVTATPTSAEGGGIIPPLSSILSGITSVLPTIIPTQDPGPTSTSEPVTAVPDPTSTTSDGGGIIPTLSSILSGITSVLPTIIPTPTSDPGPTPTSEPGTTVSASIPTTSDGGIIPTLSSILSGITSILPTIISTPSDPVTTPTSQPTTSDGGVIPTLSSILSSLTSGLPTVIPTSISDPVTTPTSPPVTSDGPTDVPTSQPTSLTSDTPTGPPTSVPTSEPPVTDPPVTDPSSSVPTSIPTSIPTSVPTITITFPTSTDDSSGNGTTITDAPSPTTTIPINSDLSFILTEPSLAFESISSTASEPTLTDPDQATTTVDSQPLAAATTLSVAPLPTGIPARIYPKVQLDMSQNMDGFTIISILFNQELNWPFVVQNQVSSSQIFAYLPVIIATALSIPVTDIKTWALQVYVPSSYKSPSDSIQLGTMWLGYIPTDQVDTLAAEIKTKQSAFYTGVPDGVARALASHVNSGFSINSVADPNTGDSGPGAANGSASSDNGKSRQDAIIGVVSALGAVALLVLVFLVYRSMKRRRELAHRRLSDPPDAGAFVVGSRPDGREFDQDSVGGARRRSFYYAEDSLRGFQGDRNDENQYDSRTSPTMSQRRNLAPATISAPILQQSSMNW